MDPPPGAASVLGELDRLELVLRCGQPGAAELDRITASLRELLDICGTGRQVGDHDDLESASDEQLFALIDDLD